MTSHNPANEVWEAQKQYFRKIHIATKRLIMTLIILIVCFCIFLTVDKYQQPEYLFYDTNNYGSLITLSIVCIILLSFSLFAKEIDYQDLVEEFKKILTSDVKLSEIDPLKISKLHECGVCSTMYYQSYTNLLSTEKKFIKYAGWYNSAELTVEESASFHHMHQIQREILDSKWELLKTNMLNCILYKTGEKTFSETDLEQIV